MNARLIWLAVYAGWLLTGCGGGAKLLKEPEPMPAELNPIASASDGALSARLDWVIVRDGPGTWSRNADWDEYLLQVQNRSSGALTITAARLEDSSGFVNDSIGDRKALVKATRSTAKRYDDEGIKVKAGAGAGSMVLAGTAAGAAGLTLGAAVAYGSSAAAAGALGAILAAPVIIGGGFVRASNTNKVHQEIVRRHTDFPFVLGTGEGQAMDVFFPISPSPQRLVLTYQIYGREGELVIDTSVSLGGLHLAAAD